MSYCPRSHPELSLNLKLSLSTIAEDVVAEMALEVADIELEAARKAQRMGKVLAAAAGVAQDICDEVLLLPLSQFRRKKPR